MDLQQLRDRLKLYKQEHLLQFWDTLSTQQQDELYKDLDSIDYKEMCGNFQQSTNETTNGHDEENEKGKSIDDRMEPIADELCASVNRATPLELDTYKNTAMKHISQGHVGVLLLAGGQGTRLGVPYPKGMYDIGLPSRKTLYQIQVERILRLEKLSLESTSVSGGHIFMYVMTSEHTKAPTEAFFKQHNYFGMSPTRIVFFEQRMIPCFDFQGKIILTSPSKVARAPDGNGGLYWALKHENVLEHMKCNGVKYLHVYCVDNVLVKVADPTFMGYCIEKDAESGNKVVEKSVPSEAVGVVCKVDGKFQVVEYSEIGEANAAATRPGESQEKLLYNAGNICNHFFTIDFLLKVCNKYHHMLPNHVARKKIPFADQNGVTVKPSEANGVKLEKFVFDVFQFSDNFVVWECLRQHEFSPLKNADGADKDTPTTARQALFNLHKTYVEKAGGVVIPDDVGVTKVEISPMVSYEGENLGEIVAGKTFSSPVMLE